MSIVTLSIRDIPYPLSANTAYHPINTQAALQRIRKEFGSTKHDSTMSLLLGTVFRSPKARSVWAIIFEQNNQPYYIVRNLAHTNTTLAYRRVLRIDLDTFTFRANSTSEFITMSDIRHT